MVFHSEIPPKFGGIDRKKRADEYVRSFSVSAFFSKEANAYHRLNPAVWKAFQSSQAAVAVNTRTDCIPPGWGSDGIKRR